MLRPFLVVLVAALIAVSSQACRQIAGIHDRSPAQDECAGCVRGDCPAEAAACLAGSPCRDRLVCAEACDVGDSACSARCERAFPGAGDAFAAVETCRAGACAARCGLRCGGAALPIAEDAATACDACVATQCCAEATACASSADCTRILECVPKSPAGDATSGCVDFRYPAGRPAWDALAGCRRTGCVDACNVGTSWACVDHVPPRAAVTDSIDVGLYVLDAAQQSMPVKGLSVRACSVTDIDCASAVPGAAAVTDTSGYAALTLPTISQVGRRGFIGFLEITDPASVYVTLLGFVGTIATEPRSARRIIAPTVATEKSFLGLVGLVPDADHGIVVATVTDCLGDNARGVTISTDSSDPIVHVFYLRFGLPSASATDTDSGGSLIVGLLKPGPVTLTARAGDTQQVVGTVRIFARANAISLTQITPAPSGL